MILMNGLFPAEMANYPLDISGGSSFELDWFAEAEVVPRLHILAAPKEQIAQVALYEEVLPLENHAGEVLG